ncbi:hypothetical protein [Arthrobacter agilis]|uniref:hypothetical protein n=1 Tax=Arthrobacter agilis TaxID=37921 RepID=UPI001ABFCB76|nr:hypothetical protein [Arthrobacter agilis]
MFGLSFEKLLLIMLVAGLIVGPQRLPLYTEKLAHLVRTIRNLTDTAKTRATAELGADFDPAEWKKLDPRNYDPRRIIQDTLADTPTTPTEVASSKPVQELDDIEGSQETGQDTPTTVPAVARGGWQEALLARTGAATATSPELVSKT